LEAHDSWELKENVNAPVLLTAFHSNNPGAIRMIKEEKKDCIQGTWSYELEECTRGTKPQPHMANSKVMYLKSVEMKLKGSAAMAEPEQNPSSPSCTFSRQTERSSTVTLLPPEDKKHIQEFAQRY
jgi:hypothetical protein